MNAPQRANPGGLVDPKFIVGRDRLIESIWSTLDQQSILMTAERRIGKTHIMRKMECWPPAGWTTILFDLESTATAEEFARKVADAVNGHLSRFKRSAKRVSGFLDRIEKIDMPGIGGLKVAGRSRAWKELLTAAVEDLEHVDTRLLFFFDELTYMVQRIKQGEGEQTAMEVLDLLRAMRQTYSSFRMVVSGSVGLHHVLTQLRAAGHANPVVGDLYPLEVPPIDEPDALELAGSLLAGEKLDTDDHAAVTRRIAVEGCGWPFLIHHIVKQLATSSSKVDSAQVDFAVNHLLTAPNDPLQMGHFRDRLKEYYPGRELAAAAILDALALSSNPLTFDEVLRHVNSSGIQTSRAELLVLIRFMHADHYLARDSQDGRYLLALPLFTRWWKLDRGL